MGQTIPVIGAEDIRGTDIAALEQQIGRAALQLAELQQLHATRSARCREVMVAHGAALEDPAKSYRLDSIAMTLTRVK